MKTYAINTLLIFFQLMKPMKKIFHDDLIYKTSSYMNEISTYKPTTITLIGKLLDLIFPGNERVKRAAVPTTGNSSSGAQTVQFIFYRDSVLFPGKNVPVEVGRQCV